MEIKQQLNYIIKNQWHFFLILLHLQLLHVSWYAELTATQSENSISCLWGEDFINTLSSLSVLTPTEEAVH